MPIITSAVALLIIILDIANGNQYNRRLKTSIALYLGSHTITMSGALVYFYFPVAFMYLNALFMLSFMLLPIFLYAFIFQVTRTHPDEKFSKLHVVAPALLSLLLLVLTLTVPTNEQMLTITGNGQYKGGSKLFFYISNNKMLFRLLFSLVYTTLSFMRFPKYSQFIKHYSSNESKSSLRWLKIFLIFIACLIPVPAAGVILSRTGLVGSWIPWVHYTILLVQHSYMAYHLVKQNYVALFETEQAEPEDLEEYVAAPEQAWVCAIEMPTDEQNSAELATNAPEKGEPNAAKKTTLSKEEFEQYLQQAKPFLNPELKITDLVDELKTNRTYISAFINSEFRMNFSCFINKCRIDEFEQRRNTQKYHHLTDEELSETVGFKTYRSYLRVRSQLANREGC